MSTTTPSPSAADLWSILKKEITGIQLLWETVNGLYFQPLGKEWQALKNDAPSIVSWTQTAMVESLLMRISRMMDPVATGKLKNLSIKQLVAQDARIGVDETALRGIWDGSGLVNTRNKYLSHNDLNRSLTENHTLNIPLEPADVEALKKLTEGLRKLRQDVNLKLSNVACVDQLLDQEVKRDIQTLGKTLLGGNLFFELLPEHACLQQALESAKK